MARSWLARLTGSLVQHSVTKRRPIRASLDLEFLETRIVPQASRTWVSGLGDDFNPGTRLSPCKTFAGVISKTLAGGEIDVS
jgi:hypothetical protein